MDASEKFTILKVIGFTRQRILDLFRFIDWVLSLSKDADQRFWQELSNFEEMQKMPYITSVERIGFERGEQKGMIEILVGLLGERFGLVPDWVNSKLSQADLETLKGWSKRIFRAEKIDDVFQ